jgi:hypothetical protein
VVVCDSADRLASHARGIPILEGVTALTVHVNRAELLDDLVASFRTSGCTARRIGLRSCEVEHTAAYDENEARVEVTFFLRAWLLRHPLARASLAG